MMSTANQSNTPAVGFRICTDKAIVLKKAGIHLFKWLAKYVDRHEHLRFCWQRIFNRIVEFKLSELMAEMLTRTKQCTSTAEVRSLEQGARQISNPQGTPLRPTR